MSTTSGIDVVLFDLGGVLVDFGGVEAMKELSGITDDDELWHRWLTCRWVREFERDGVIGQLHDEYFMTVGSGMSTDDARRFAGEMAAELRGAEVDAVIFTAT